MKNAAFAFFVIGLGLTAFQAVKEIQNRPR